MPKVVFPKRGWYAPNRQSFPRSVPADERGAVEVPNNLIPFLPSSARVVGRDKIDRIDDKRSIFRNAVKGKVDRPGFVKGEDTELARLAAERAAAIQADADAREDVSAEPASLSARALTEEAEADSNDDDDGEDAAPVAEDEPEAEAGETFEAPDPADEADERAKRAAAFREQLAAEQKQGKLKKATARVGRSR